MFSSDIRIGVHCIRKGQRQGGKKRNSLRIFLGFVFQNPKCLEEHREFLEGGNKKGMKCMDMQSPGVTWRIISLLLLEKEGGRETYELRRREEQPLFPGIVSREAITSPQPPELCGQGDI